MIGRNVTLYDDVYTQVTDGTKDKWLMRCDMLGGMKYVMAATQPLPSAPSTDLLFREALSELNADGPTWVMLKGGPTHVVVVMD